MDDHMDGKVEETHGDMDGNKCSKCMRPMENGICTGPCHGPEDACKCTPMGEGDKMAE